MSKIGKQLKTELVLKSPRVTEKATALTGLKSGGAYTFEIASNVTKPMVEEAFISKYKVQPVKVNIVNLPAKKIFRRGRLSTKSATKKAIVFLKAGDKIEIV